MFGQFLVPKFDPRHKWRSSSLAALAAVLVGCADEDSSNASTMVANTAPELGADAAVSVPENTTQVVTVSGTDADGDSLTYDVAGGADAALFQINAGTGELSFLLAPNFEEPSDADGNNVYEVSVSVSDGQGGSDTTAYTITVTDGPDTRYIDQIFAETAITDDIPYATTDGQEYYVNVVTPVGDTEVNRPLILFAPGGAFVSAIPELMLPFAESFARRGYVTAIMDYRIADEPPEGGDEFRLAALNATHDMIAAVRFLKANAAEYGIDPNTVLVGGASAGATMAIAVGTTDPDDPTTPLFDQYLEDTGGVYGNIGDNLDQSPAVQGVFALSGAVFDLQTIDINSAPIYAAHEELDTVAPCYTFQLGGSEFVASGTCDFVPFYQAVGVPAQSFIVLGDDGHVDFSDEEYAVIFAEATQFFVDNVLNTED